MKLTLLEIVPQQIRILEARPPPALICLHGPGRYPYPSSREISDNSSSMRSVRLLLTFAIVFSLVSLPSALSSNFNLPNIPVVRAQQETTLGSWYPAGAQMETLTISTFNGPILEMNSIACPPNCPPNVDLTDSPLTA